MSQPKISVIIPIFNAGKTVQQSIKSATNQTLKDVEIICIDNNSTDDSKEKVKEEQSFKKANIKLTTEKKQGAGPARNKGIKLAKGEFIFFLDPDDEIYDRDTLKRLYNAAKKNNVKIAGGSVYIFDKATSQEHPGDERYYFKRSGMIDYKDYQFDWGYWRFIYDREFLNSQKIKFPPYLRGQDTVFFVKAMVSAGKFYAIKNATYRYNYCFSKKKHSPKTYADYEKANLEVISIAQKNRLKHLEEAAQSHRMPLVSVIIPIYNVEKYLRDCLDSILNQTYQNTEIILVDDKSPDRSGEIAEEYALKDERIKVIHKPKNEGLNMARATGFKASKGEYITFVDSDDMLANGFIEKSIKTLMANKVDFVRCGVETYKNKQDIESKLSSPPFGPERILRGKKDLYLTQFKGLSDIDMLMCVWGAVYKRSKVEKINWKDSNYRVYEDNIWTLRLLENTDTAAYVDAVGYFYRYDATINNVLSKSITNNNFNGKKVGYLEYLDILIKEYRKYNKRYSVDADKEIDAFARTNWAHRLKTLIQRDACNTENNPKYLPEALKWLDRDHDHLREKNAQYQTKIRDLQVEIESFLGTKRSVKLFVGNIKRKISKLVR